MELHEEPPEAVVREHWLVVNARDAEELGRAADALARPEVHGALVYSTHGLPVWEAFQRGYRFVQAAGGAVQDERGRLLVIERLGLWDLPKGKVDPGEAIDAAALREVREECGLRTLRLLRPLAVTWHTYARKGAEHLKRTDWFLMQGASSDALVPQHEEDITEARWVDRAGIAAIRAATYPSLRAVIDAWEAQG